MPRTVWMSLGPPSPSTLERSRRINASSVLLSMLRSYPGLADRVRLILKRRGEFSECRMFGGVAFMINGHMCCGVTKTDLVVRMQPDDVVAALRRPHTRPMDFTGKPMRSMIFVDAHGTDRDEALGEWVESAIAFVRTLPPKKAPAKGASDSSRSRPPAR